MLKNSFIIIHRESAQALMACILAILLFSGCARKIYIPTESRNIIRDTIRLAEARVDSVTIRDSIVTEVRGDTVTREVWRWRMKTRVRHDTVVRILRDSVAHKEKAVEQIPQPKPSLARRISARIAVLLLAAFVAILALCALKSFSSRRRG